MYNPIKNTIKDKMSHYSNYAGLPPGTLINHEGNSVSAQMDLTIYNKDTFQEMKLESSDLSELSFDENKFVWINIIGSMNRELLKKVGEKFELNHLSIEDIQNSSHRPKIDDFGNYIHTILKMLMWDENHETLLSEQINILWGANYVISIQERSGDVFDNIRDRIRTNKGRVRKAGADYLAYALIDALVDNYFIICDHLQEQQEILDEYAVVEKSKETFQKIHQLKKQLITLRKSIWPLREILLTIQKEEIELISESTYKYFKDVYDHTLFIIDLVEQLREILTGLQESQISMISFDMNNVMKVLTIISTIFIPLTFIVGVYGMNFLYMPELTYKWGYFIVLGIMFLLFIIMMIFFKRKKWI
jgi:magnesium transporter